MIDGINKFIDYWNNIKLKVPEVNIPFVGKVGGFTIQVPQIANIPMLARGGIVDQPTLAMIGERGKEAVVPLENTAFVDTLAGAIGSAVMGAMQFNNSQNTVTTENREVSVEMDGNKLIRILLPKMNDELIRMGYKSIYQIT